MAEQFGVPGIDEQSRQAPPPVPHASLPAPATHKLVLPSQQPPLQSVSSGPLQLVEQVLVEVLQALPDRQSPAAMQPQAPPTHLSPFMPPMLHAVQRTPPVAHAEALVPMAQVVPSQQPPLHAEVPLHVVEHVVPLHALPALQSL
jgi:hypothetical protein